MDDEVIVYVDVYLVVQESSYDRRVWRTPVSCENNYIIYVTFIETDSILVIFELINIKCI